MEMQSKLNEMLRKKLHKAMEEEICDCQMMDEVDQKEALHRILLFQEIVSYFDENQVSSKEAAMLRRSRRNFPPRNISPNERRKRTLSTR